MIIAVAAVSAWAERPDGLVLCAEWTDPQSCALGGGAAADPDEEYRR